MSLSDLASLGSFVSGVAVLASLLFLYFQMKQMTEQVKQGERNQQALIQMGRSTRLIDSIYRQVEPHLGSVIQRGRRGDPSMSTEEIETFLRANYAALLNFEDTYLQSREGTIHSDAWENTTGRLKRFFAAPGARVSWKKWRDNFGSDFAEAVDQVVSQARTSSWEELSASWASDIADEKRLAS